MRNTLSCNWASALKIKRRSLSPMWEGNSMISTRLRLIIILAILLSLPPTSSMSESASSETSTVLSRVNKNIAHHYLGSWPLIFLTPMKLRRPSWISVIKSSKKETSRLVMTISCHGGSSTVSRRDILLLLILVLISQIVLSLALPISMRMWRMMMI